MIRKSTPLAAVLAVFCIACNQKKSSADQISLDEKTNQAKMINADKIFNEAGSVIVPNQQTNNNKKNRTQPSTIQIDWDKKIVKTANLNVEIKDYKVFSLQLSEKVKNTGDTSARKNKLNPIIKLKIQLLLKFRLISLKVL